MFSTFYEKISNVIDKQIHAKQLSKGEVLDHACFENSIHTRNNLYSKFIYSSFVLKTFCIDKISFVFEPPGVGRLTAKQKITGANRPL